MGPITYNVRSGDQVFETDERGARAALAHASVCRGCGEAGAFHRSDIYGQSLTPAAAFAMTLPTGAVLYPGSNPHLPVGERVAAVLAILRRVAGKGTPTTRKAVADRIARLEAYRPR